MGKKYVKITILLVLVSIISSNIFAFAHDSMLNVSYDSCAPATTSNNDDYIETLVEDGEDEL